MLLSDRHAWEYANARFHSTTTLLVPVITYIRTQEGWLYLAVVLDLFSRQIIDWAVKPRMTADLAVDALLMAVCLAAQANAAGTGILIRAVSLLVVNGRTF
jgi:hypothetical protein